MISGSGGVPTLRMSEAIIGADVEPFTQALSGRRVTPLEIEGSVEILKNLIFNTKSSKFSLPAFPKKQEGFIQLWLDSPAFSAHGNL